MARVRTIEKGDYTVGEYLFGPRPIPLGRRRFQVAIDRTEFGADTGDEIGKLELQITFDRGTTWRRLAAVGFRGGTYIRRDGTTATETRLTVRLPQPDNPDRGIRGRLRVLSPTRTAVDVDDEV